MESRYISRLVALCNLYLLERPVRTKSGISPPWCGGLICWVNAAVFLSMRDTHGSAMHAWRVERMCQVACQLGGVLHIHPIPREIVEIIIEALVQPLMATMASIRTIAMLIACFKRHLVQQALHLSHLRDSDSSGSSAEHWQASDLQSGHS